MIGHRVSLYSADPKRFAFKRAASVTSLRLAALSSCRSVELCPDGDRRTAACAAMKICITQRVGATAILLLVELLALADLDHTLRAAALAPVEVPIGKAFIGRRGP